MVQLAVLWAHAVWRRRISPCTTSHSVLVALKQLSLLWLHRHNKLTKADRTLGNMHSAHTSARLKRGEMINKYTLVIKKKNTPCERIFNDSPSKLSPVFVMWFLKRVAGLKYLFLARFPQSSWYLSLCLAGIKS